jgi:hypothetical protein
MVENDMRLSKVDDVIYPLDMPGQARPDVASLKGFKPLKLTPAEKERLEVITTMNEAQAQTVYANIPQILSDEVRSLTTTDAAIAAQAATMGMRPAPLLHPPKPMILAELLDWLTTTPAFQAASDGRGGGKEAAFQAAVQVYKEWGQKYFLELERDLGSDIAARETQGRIQQDIQRFPTPDREPMRLMLEHADQQARPRMRGVMGIDRLRIGAP